MIQQARIRKLGNLDDDQEMVSIHPFFEKKIAEYVARPRKRFKIRERRSGGDHIKGLI